MNQVCLYKKTRKVEKDGKKKVYVNFYVKCGEDLIPVQVRFFPNDDGVDPMFKARKMTLKNFAEELSDD